MTSPSDRLDLLAVDTIRTLSIDGVQQANSGHPGAPMGAAAMAYALWTRHLRHAPTQPAWPDRDRFVLSAGHASMLLYSLLHLTGYAVSLDDLKSFRQWGSITPGHPEYGMTPGVEATTGPLGQGLANAVGMAIAERRLAAEFNRPGHDVVDHHTYVICSDGDLQEGITAEACSLAGHLRLGKLIALYDDNRIQLDGPTAWAFSGGRARPLRRLRLAHPARRGRQRRRGDLGRHRGRQGRRPPLDHRRPHPHRLRQPEQAGLAEGPRRPARPGRGPPHQGGLRLGPGQDASSSRTRRASCSAAPSPRARRCVAAWNARMDAYAADVPGRGRRAASGASRGDLPAGWDAGAPGLRDRHRGRHPERQPGRDPGAGRGAAGAVRRVRGPVRVQPDRRQGPRPRPLRGRARGPQPPLRRPRARDGRHRQRHRATTAGSSRTAPRS